MKFLVAFALDNVCVPRSARDRDVPICVPLKSIYASSCWLGHRNVPILKTNNVKTIGLWSSTLKLEAAACYSGTHNDGTGKAGASSEAEEREPVRLAASPTQSAYRLSHVLMPKDRGAFLTHHRATSPTPRPLVGTHTVTRNPKASDLLALTRERNPRREAPEDGPRCYHPTASPPRTRSRRQQNSECLIRAIDTKRWCIRIHRGYP